MDSDYSLEPKPLIKIEHIDKYAVGDVEIAIMPNEIAILKKVDAFYGPSHIIKFTNAEFQMIINIVKMHYTIK